MGDEVLTAGGIVGHIIDIDGDRVTLETSVGASFVVLQPVRAPQARTGVPVTMTTPRRGRLDEPTTTSRASHDDGDARADEHAVDADDPASDDEDDDPDGRAGRGDPSPAPEPAGPPATPATRPSGEDPSGPDGPPII